MSSGGPETGLLVRVAQWGQVSIVESGRGPVMELQRLPTSASRLKPALHTAQRWCEIQSPAVTRVTSSTSARAANGSMILVVEREAPAGSTLDELIEAHGSLDGVMVAGLFLELLIAVREAHKAGLTLGKLTPRDLFVCPPGVAGVAALRAHQAGLTQLLCEAQGPLGTATERRFQQVLDDLACVPPEVADGAVPDAASDVYMLCASMGRALLGTNVHDGVDPWASRERARAGVLPQTALSLEQSAPGVGRLITKGMAVQPLLRRGVISELIVVFQTLLGAARCKKVMVGQGGDPWEMGSPLIPLAAYVRARPYSDRFSEQRSADSARKSVLVPVAARSGEQTGDRTAIVGNRVDQARVAAAISELKILRAQAERKEKRGATTTVKILVVIFSIAIAWAIAYIGFQRTERVAMEFQQPTVRHTKPLPKAPQPKVLYTTPSQE